MTRRILATFAALACCAISTLADPLSKKFDIDFFRDVPSRDLKGLATRSDGRLVGGPIFTDITASAPADLLWCIEPTDDPARYLVGTGPDGRIIEVTLNSSNASYGTRQIAKLEDPQVFALKRLPDGTILAGTSPRGALHLIRDGKPVARAQLPVDSIFDLLVLDAKTVLAATGNPARIFRIDLVAFARAGIVADKMTDLKILADRGITPFGEIRDRNVRRIAALPDGRIVAGSSPKGNVYLFDATGGSPVILQENRDAEVTDLLPMANGDLYATIVYSGTTGESRITPPARGGPSPRERESTDSTPPPPVQVDKFGGRSALVWFPRSGFPETLASRSGVAFYRLARFGDTLVIGGGDAGEVVGYDLKNRLSLTFAGSASAQLNGIVPIANTPGRFLVLRNNAPGLAILDFNSPGPLAAETRRIDLATPARIGALRFNRLRQINPSAILAEAQVNMGTDDVEGWGPWTPLQLGPDGGWRAPDLRGRSVKFRFRLPSQTVPAAGRRSAPETAGFELDRATLFALPQNRRPQLQDFRVLSPGFALIVPPESPPPAVVSLNQLLQSGPRDDAKGRGNVGNSQVVPQPGAQVVLWTVTDPDADNILSTFSIRRDGDEGWTDVVTNTANNFAQFDTGHLPDGLYFTRLVATETAPRPESDRLSHTFETDDLIVDHTAPEVLEATARRVGEDVVVTVRGRDSLSLLHGLGLTFSNGIDEMLEQPLDGIRDGREETFVFEIPIARISNATSVEMTLFDAAGNGSTRRLRW